MKTKTIILYIALLCFTAVNIFASESVIKGKILDAGDKTPVAYASLLLLKQDSTYITGVISNIEGYFEINHIPNEECLLSISFMGYKTTCFPITSSANNDTLHIFLEQSSISLNEVTIQARSVIVKDDRKVILPSEEQIKMSADGTDVIRMMQLPRIMVDPVSGEITMSGNKEIQLRINGVQVTNAEIASIPPADILRIEYYDDPGARYGNADAVIDYITRRKESGGNVNGVFFNGGGNKRKSLDNRLSLKYNHKNSEFSTNATFVQRKQDWTREYNEKLIFPDHTLHQIELGQPTPFNKKVFAGNFNYSLVDKDQYVFNAQFRYTHNDFPNSYEDRKSELYTSGRDVPLYIFDHTVEKANSPALDIYFLRKLKNEQQLIFNIVGTYIDTDSKRIYQEKEENNLLTNIRSDIDGSKYSMIAEGIYEKKIGQNKLTGGMKHLQSYTNNKYAGTTIADVSMRQAESSVYAEYQGRTGKWGYMVNITGTRLYYSQNNKHTEKYTVQPSARVTFEPDKDLYFRYRINLRNNTPSLAAMNEVDQQIDTWQIRRGNPDLDAFNTLSQSFTTGYNKGILSVDLLIGYDYEYNPIMESVFYADEKFIRTYENQKSFQNLSAEATFRLRPWKNHVSLSVTPRINRFISKGNEYIHTYTMPELRVNLDLSYGNWLANFTTITPPRSMYGEQLMKSDQMYTIMAGYKQTKWSVMAGVLNPFTGEYKTDNKNWSALNPVDSKIHTKNNRSFLVKLSFNLNYGRQFKVSRKQINHEDTDAGIMQGIKN